MVQTTIAKYGGSLWDCHIYVSQYLFVIVKTDHQAANFFGYTVRTVHVCTTMLVHAVNLTKNCNHDFRCGSTKIKMKFATYQSTGFHYRSRRPTFKPQKTVEATASDENATIQPPQAVELIPEQKPPVSFLVKLI